MLSSNVSRSEFFSKNVAFVW